VLTHTHENGSARFQFGLGEPESHTGAGNLDDASPFFGSSLVPNGTSSFVSSKYA